MLEPYAITLLARWVGAVDVTVDDHEGFRLPVMVLEAITVWLVLILNYD